MSVASAVTARLMETWAHGQDIADALGVQREASVRLRHVAHLGVATRAFSFANRGRPAPGAPIRVELTGPSGECGRGARRARRTGSPGPRSASACWSRSGGT